MSNKSKNIFVGLAVVLVMLIGKAMIVQAMDNGVVVSADELFCKTEEYIKICTTKDLKPFMGKAVERYEDGQIKSEATYVNGKRESVRKEYHKNGQIKREEIYKDGKRNGGWKRYYENGKLKEKGLYKDGKRNGVWMLYDENETLKEEGVYKDGKRSGVWRVYENGMLKKESMYVGGREIVLSEDENEGK